MINHDVKIFCALRRSPAYDVDYVYRLKEQADVYAPGVPFVCISDTPLRGIETIPMKRMWPGWWCKMEMFAPNITGDIFFIDLDTIIVDDISDFLNLRKLTMLTDFYKKESYGSGLMYIPEEDRAVVWNHFNTNPPMLMQQFRIGGDQRYLMSIWKNRPKRFQEELPDRTISYKAHKVKADGIPAGTGIVCHHGLPKPRDVKWTYPGLTYNRGKWVRT